MMSGTISCVVGDDHELLRRGLATLLRAEPELDVVGEAADGETALALVERRRPTAVVLDVHMGALDGIEVCRRIVARGLPTTVVLYTGDDDVALLDAALEAGAHGFVVKSGSAAELVRAVRVVAAGDVFVDPALAGALLLRRRGAAAAEPPLSVRELDVLGLLANGLTTDEMGRELFLSPTTVRSYVENAMHKLGARNRSHLVAVGLRTGLVR